MSCGSGSDRAGVIGFDRAPPFMERRLDLGVFEQSEAQVISRRRISRQNGEDGRPVLRAIGAAHLRRLAPGCFFLGNGRSHATGEKGAGDQEDGFSGSGRKGRVHETERKSHICSSL